MSSATRRRLASRRRRTRPTLRCRRLWGVSRVSRHDVHRLPVIAPLRSIGRANCIRPHEDSHTNETGWRRPRHRGSLSSPEEMTSNAMSSRREPQRAPHDKQTEFSNARCCPQLGQRKSRMGHCPFERRHVRRGVDHTPLRAGHACVVINGSHLQARWGFGQGGYVCSAGPNVHWGRPSNHRR